MNGEASALQREIGQRRPFRSTSQEATLALFRTADLLRRHFARVVEARGVTMQQYNVLRILRGAGPEGVPTLAIADRMIEQAPGVTRLLDRLEAKGWVRRERCTEDRRQMLCWITEAGARLLAELDGPVDAADDEALAMLSPDDQKILVRLLDAIRAGHEG